jgi:hypothetical protein
MTREFIRTPPPKNRTPSIKSIEVTPIAEIGMFLPSQIHRSVDPLWVGDAHFLHSFYIGGFRGAKAAQDLAVQATHGGGGEYAFRCSADSYDARSDSATFRHPKEFRRKIAFDVIRHG